MRKGFLLVLIMVPATVSLWANGGNPRAASLSGIRVNLTKIVVYCFSGICAVLVGLIIASQLLAAHPATGRAAEMDTIAAAVLRGPALPEASVLPVVRSPVLS